MTKRHSTNRAKNRKRSRTSGQTLLELIAATTIVSIALVPALRLMRDSIGNGAQAENANILATYSMSKLEEHMALTAATWDTTTASGAIPNYPGMRFQVTKVDEGIGSGLMRITSIAYEDGNANGTWDATERRVIFVTKVARNAAYALEAS